MAFDTHMPNEPSLGLMLGLHPHESADREDTGLVDEQAFGTDQDHVALARLGNSVCHIHHDQMPHSIGDRADRRAKVCATVAAHSSRAVLREHRRQMRHDAKWLAASWRLCNADRMASTRYHVGPR